MLVASHFPQKALHDLAAITIIAKGNTDAAQQRGYIAFLGLGRGIAATEVVKYRRIERFQALPGDLLALFRTTDLFHQAEQQVRGMIIQVQALDKATGNSD